MLENMARGEGKYLVDGSDLIHETQYERLPCALSTAAGLAWAAVKANEWSRPVVQGDINGRTKHRQKV